MNEAAILAMRCGRETILMSDLREAVDKVMMGEKLDRKPIQSEKERISYHEIGHALVSELMRPGSVSTVTVTPRGQALGYMRQSPRDDQYLYTKDELLDQISICVGGAVAEEIIFGNRSTGSFGDFEQANSLAKKMVLGGMSPLGVVSEETLPGNLLHEAMQEIIQEQVVRVRELLGERVDAVREIASKLIAEERVSGELFRSHLQEVA
jgi:vesicle-fusing ATPase